MGNSLEHHRVRKNHVANDSNEVIFAQVVNDKKSEEIRENIRYDYIL